MSDKKTPETPFKCAYRAPKTATPCTKPAQEGTTRCATHKSKIHMSEVTIGKNKVQFPTNFLGCYEIKTERLNQYVLVDKDTTILSTEMFVCQFLQNLAGFLTDGLTLRKAIDNVSADNLETKIQVLRDLGFRLPLTFPTLGSGTKKTRETINALTNQSNLIEILMEKIQIRLNIETLKKLATVYPWYIQASRRAVTLAHVSKTGLKKNVIKFIGELTKTHPDLAFLLSPTTLHDNSLVDPSVAIHFTCDPFARHFSEMESRLFPEASFESVITEDTWTRFKGANALPIATRKLADARMKEIMKPLRTADGFFPWNHPTKENCGVVLAGGLPAAAGLVEDQWKAILDAGSDIDLFVYGDTEEDRTEMVGILLRHLEKVGGKVESFKSVVQVKGLGRDIQVICPFARSPLGVLINFDTTFIQIGYRESAIPGQEYSFLLGNAEPEWFSTPGYCYFTPRGQALITRYNIRMFRLLKMLKRGFMPVSDERGHLLYPTKNFFSSVFKMDIAQNHGYNKEWIEERAITDYMTTTYDVDYRKKKLGEDRAWQYKSLKTLKVKDESKLNEMRDLWTLRAEENKENHPMTVKIIFPAFAVYPAFVDPKKGLVFQVSSAKPRIEWKEAKTVDELMATFDPNSATLSNGFDIYTQSVNSTLPMPTDGKTCDLYGFNSVLLRNCRLISPKDTRNEINLAAPKEKPLLVPRVPLSDNKMSYPQETWGRRTWDSRGKETIKNENNNRQHPVRELEGIFLFGEPRPQEEVDADLAELKAKEDAKLAKIQKHRLQYAKQREAERIANKEAKKSGKPSTAEDVEKILATLKDDDVSVLPTKPNKYEKPESSVIKKLQFKDGLEFEDLHAFVKVEKKDEKGKSFEHPLATIEIWELPLMMKAFADGAKTYKSVRKMQPSGKFHIVEKCRGMVKVRAPVTLDNALVFDVDDLLLAPHSLDAYASRRYNVVVQIVNLTRWIIEFHEHADLAVRALDSKVLMDVLASKISDTKELSKFFPKDEKYPAQPHVSDFMRALRYIANNKEFEEQCRKEVCRLPHAHDGLLGEMPVLDCNRFYVCKHNAKATD